jgi:hypothetical protein
MIDSNLFIAATLPGRRSTGVPYPSKYSHEDATFSRTHRWRYAFRTGVAGATARVCVPLTLSSLQ